MRLLNVGGNSKAIPLPAIYDGWEHHLLDIDPTGKPDIVCDARDLTTLPPARYDAVYCSHNLEHYHQHEVSKVLAGFRHVLKAGGFAHIRVPDIAEVMRRVSVDSLDIEDTLYQSALGPISVHDVIYGLARQIESSGCDFFAHKTGFTRKSLAAALARGGFSHAIVVGADLELVAYAFKGAPTQELLASLGLAAPILPAVAEPVKESDDVKKLSVTELLARADNLVAAGRPYDTIALYRSWLADVDSALAYVVRYNLGHLLGNLGDLPGAREAYRAALVQNPEFAQARLNLGTTLEREGDRRAAIAEWERALQGIETAGSPDRELLKHALNNLGRLLEVEHRYPEAEAMLVRSLSVSPIQEDVIHHLVHLRQKQCEWPIYAALPGISSETMIDCTSAMAMLSASDDPELQLRAAKKFVSGKVRTDLSQMAPAHGYNHERLRVGYLSSNFGLHAVTILTAEMFELHDRQRIEVYGFSCSPDDGTDMARRVRNAMDHFVEVHHLSDEAAAAAIREAEIDVLIDLQGLTQGLRANILACRPAPVQVTYLGFPGTTGLPWIDYVLADRYIIPEESERFFTEKPLLMPDCFQVNDRQRAIGAVRDRREYGLPEQGVVFCGFTHNHKFTPDMFGAWMRILRQTPGSTLWLLADNDVARKNLIANATGAGIDASRLVFAPRIQPDEYLARFQAADLFLDTMPFNGGATASDALWAGLPILTLSGRSFASRMAGSLLHAVGLPELVANSFAEYESKAVILASEPERLVGLRNRLATNRLTSPLFDTPRFVRALDRILESIAVHPGNA